MCLHVYKNINFVNSHKVKRKLTTLVGKPNKKCNKHCLCCLFSTRLKLVTVRTTRPEKCEIFAQRYQSGTMATKFQTLC